MTRRREEKGWRHFADWCAARGLRALPAHPWTVAAYLRWCEPRCRPPVIAARLRAIARAHLLGGHRPPDRSPVVQRTLRALERRGPAPGRLRALFRAADFASPVKPLPPSGEAASPPRPGRRPLRSTPPLVSRRTKKRQSTNSLTTS
jgi:hypothetical protein